MAQQRENLLSAPQGKGGNQDRARRWSARWMALLRRSISASRGETGRELAVAARRFHEQHVRFHVLEPGALRMVWSWKQTSPV